MKTSFMFRFLMLSLILTGAVVTCQAQSVSEAGAFDANVGPTWAYNGLLDEFLLFHRPLSADEIAHLATGPDDPFVDTTTSVDPADKLSTTWGSLKSAYK